MSFSNRARDGPQLPKKTTKRVAAIIPDIDDESYSLFSVDTPANPTYATSAYGGFPLSTSARQAERLLTILHELSVMSPGYPEYGGSMRVSDKSNYKKTGELPILTSWMLISPQNSLAQNLSLRTSEVPVGSE